MDGLLILILVMVTLLLIIGIAAAIGVWIVALEGHDPVGANPPRINLKRRRAPLQHSPVSP